MRLSSALAQTETPRAAPASDRLHALDAVRGLALLLGVFLHAALSFVPGDAIWIVKDDSASPTLAATMFSVHTFRMTLFFLIAGFFARMSLHRLGTPKFISDRMKRIGIPLVVGCTVLIPLILAIRPFVLVTSFGPGVMQTPLAKPPEFTPHMFPFMHLWFLYLLGFLYAGALAMRWVADRFSVGPVLGQLTDRIVTPLVKSPLGVVALGVPAGIGLFILPYPVLWNGVPPPGNGFFPTPISLVVYGLAFGFGWALQRQGQLIRQMQTHWGLQLALAIALTGFCLGAAGTSPSAAPVMTGMDRAVWTMAYGVAGWAWTFALIGMALRFMSTHSPRMRFLADASYWVYLVHMPVVILAQTAMCHLPLPWFVKFPMMMAVVIPMLLVSYQLFVRYSFIGEILNGRRGQRPAPAAVTEAPMSLKSGHSS